MRLSLSPALLEYKGSDSVTEAIRKGMRPKINWLVSTWADARRILSPKYTKQAGKWETSKVPYLREPMDNMSARSRTRATTLMKGAQLGGTEAANNTVGYRISGAPASMLYVCATRTIMKRTAGRLEQMIRDDKEDSKDGSPSLSSLVPPPRKHGSRNTDEEKHFPGGMLIMASAQSATNLRSTMAELAIFDEVDAFPPDVDGEGDVITVAEGRGGTVGMDWKQLEISTPKIAQTSIIKRRFEEGDQRHWCMPCPHCSKLIDYQLEGFRWVEGDAARTIRFMCRHCDEPILEARHKRKMVRAGVWVPKVLRDDPDAMARLESGDRSELDALNETTLHKSYYMPSFLAMIGLTWSEIFTKWDAAQGNPAKMKGITNLYFGLAYMAPGEAPEWQKVAALRNELKAREVPRWASFLTAGGDVGMDHVEIHVWAWGRRKRRHLVERIRIDGPYNEPSTWAQVDAVVQRLYLHPCGAVMPIKRFVIDRAKWPDVVDAWLAKQNPWVVLGQRGSQVFDHQIYKYTSRREKAYDITYGIPSALRVLTTGVSMLKLELYGNINLKQDGRGPPPVGTISINSETTDETCQQLVAERLEFNTPNGGVRKTPIWVPLPNRRSEALDCANYARVGAEIEGVSRWSEADFEREEKMMREQAEESADWLKVEAHRRETKGDDRPVTLRDRYPQLVMPGDQDPLVAMVEEAKDEASAVDQVPDQVPVEVAPEPAPAKAIEEDPEFAGVRTSWDNAMLPRPAQAVPVGERIVRFTDDLDDLFSTTVV